MKKIFILTACFLIAMSINASVPVPMGYGVFVPQNPNSHFFPTYPFEHGGKRGVFTLQFDVTPLDDSVTGEVAFDAYVTRWASVVKIELNNGHFRAGGSSTNELAFQRGKTYRFVLHVNCDGGDNGTYTIAITYNDGGKNVTINANEGKPYNFAQNRRNVSRLKVDQGRWEKAIPTTGTNIINLGAMGAWSTKGNFTVDNFAIDGKPEGLLYAVDDLKNLPPLTRPAGVSTFEVGPTKKFKKIQDVLGFLQNKDVVIVDGNVTYPSGILITKDNVTLRGVPVNGVRPRIKTMNSSQSSMVEITGDHVEVDGFIVEGGNNDLMAIWGYDNWNDWTGAYISNTNNCQSELRINRSSGRCIHHAGHDLTIRNCKISGSGTGIISSDLSGGAILVEYCEIFENGAGPGGHNLYLANNIGRYPEAETIVRYCYIYQSIHSAGLKTRAHINKIYYNYFYNNSQQSLELIGPDPGNESRSNNGFQVAKQINQQYGPYNQFTYRSDHDVVGNTLIYDIQERNIVAGRLVRCGADGTSALGSLFPNTPLQGGALSFGKSWGRFRFVNNTFLYAGIQSGTTSALALEFSVESLELYNNIFYSTKPDFRPVYEDVSENTNRILWTTPYGRQIAGANNAVIGVYDAKMIPSEWTGTITGTLDECPFINAPIQPAHFPSYNLNLKAGSRLAGAGVALSNTVHEWPKWTEEQAVTHVQYVYDGYDINIPSKNYLDLPNATTKVLCRDTAFPFPLLQISSSSVDPTTMKATPRNDNNKPSIGAFSGQR